MEIVIYIGFNVALHWIKSSGLWMFMNEELRCSCGRLIIHPCLCSKGGEGGGWGFVKPYALEYILGKIDNRTMRK